MIRFSSKVTPHRFVSINEAARKSQEAMQRSPQDIKPDIVDLSKFNAETNKIGFFKKLVKSVKIFFRANFGKD